MALPDESSERRRPPGRPSRLSSEQIVEAASAMLEEDGLATFSLTRLSRRLGTSVMALYSYFPSREALLDTVADSIFREFEAPPTSGPWQDRLGAWIGSLHKLFLNRPIGLKLVRQQEGIFPTWWQNWLPMVQILEEAGLKGEDLSFAATWVGENVMSTVFSAVIRPEIARSRARGLGPDGAKRLGRVARHNGPDQDRRLFEFSVANIIQNVEKLVARSAQKAPDVPPHG